VRLFHTKRVQLVAIAYALWLFSSSVAFHLQPDNKILQELTLLAGAVPAVLHAIFFPVDTRGNGPGMWFLWAFLLVFLAGYVLNDCTWEDLIGLFNVMFVFLIGLLIASSTDTSLIGRIAAAYALMLAPYLVHVNVTGTRFYGRLLAGSQPNTWGWLSLSIAIGVFALNSRLLQAGCLAVALMTMYNAQSRGSMVALIPILYMYAYHWYFHERAIDVSWKVIVTCFLVLIMFGLFVFYSEIIANDIMRLNDPYRGLQTGATGRDEEWGEALRLWFNAPLFGVGFRKHENLMVFTNQSAHNAYLAMLADTGFVGFLVYMAFLLVSLRSAMSGVVDKKLRLFLTCVILSYSLAGMFERRAINVGNSLSITFIFVCLVSLRLARARSWNPNESTGSQVVAKGMSLYQ
jgi:O-antigen ligase